MIDNTELKALTYSPALPREFTLDDNLSTFEREHNPSTLNGSPRFSLGHLEIVPLELLQAVLMHLDLWTLNEFRRVNRQAMRIVESIPQYNTIITSVHYAIPCILSIRTGHWISLETLYQTLCTAECEGCGDFGGYLYILTCKRVCFLCFTEKKEYLSLRRSHAIQKFGITRPIMSTLPCMRSIPGMYTQNRKKRPERITLIDRESAYNAGLEFHGSSTAMESYVSAEILKRTLEHDRKVSKRRENESASTSRRPSRLMSLDPVDHLAANPFRFMAIIRMPFLTGAPRYLEWGFHCIGCQKLNRRRPLHFRRKFTVETFNEHLKQCGNIQNGQHHLD